MFIKKTELYHQKNDPIKYYTPTSVSTEVYPFRDHTSYPLAAGSGIAIQFIEEDAIGNGYVRISNTLTNAEVASGSGSSQGFSLYSPGTNTFKVLQFGTNLQAVESNNIVTVSAPAVATSQSVTNSLSSYVNSISPFEDGSELIWLTKTSQELGINQTKLLNY